MVKTGVSLLMAVVAIWFAWVGGVPLASNAQPIPPTDSTSSIEVPSPAEQDATTVTSLSAVEADRLAVLHAKHVHEFSGHTELAEYLRLRSVSMRGQLPEPAQDIASFALMTIDQPYQRRAYSLDLGEADCVTFTERCIALACTDDWKSANLLQDRLRRSRESGALNREPILDWIPANQWLLDEVTAQLGVPVSEFTVVFEDRSLPTSYIEKVQLSNAHERLRTGDVLLLIADQPNPPSDPVSRLRCVHMAFIYQSGSSEAPQILHSYPPRAAQWPLDRMLKNRHVRGGKILRLKPGAREIVRAELADRVASATTTPIDVDGQVRLNRGQFGFIVAAREPDTTVEIDGIKYGAIRLRTGETLWSLFKGGWKGIVKLDVNQPFMQRHPELDMNSYQGDTIYYPMSWSNGDKALPQ